ncbi:MAG: biotin synthase BioB [Lachnospiraceae bacterium]|nr:biotin synthase BioB [Lachnospiraceae bacterium]
MDAIKLAEEIIDGRRLKKGEPFINEFITTNLNELKQGADMIRKALVGDKVDLCTIINGRSGKCSENCKFCAQSAHHNTSCDVYDLLDEETIISAARANEAEGVDRFAIVCSGHHPSDEDFERILHTYSRMNKELNLDLCTSLGFLTEEQFKKLREVGITSVHNNIETSRRYFPYICTTHTFDDKIANIKRAQKAGLNVCSGGIIGMGEDWEDRIDMAFTLSELNIKSIPINSLMAITGTPLEKNESLSEDDILRTIAIFRYINPCAEIRLAAGRALIEHDGREAFNSGASASITGNMLTTSGSTISSDLEMLTELGRDITPYWQNRKAAE